MCLLFASISDVLPEDLSVEGGRELIRGVKHIQDKFWDYLQGAYRQRNAVFSIELSTLDR